MMGYHSYSEHREPTPTEKCRELLVELRREQKQKSPNIELVTHLRYRIASFPAKVQIDAFDYLFDTNGW